MYHVNVGYMNEVRQHFLKRAGDRAPYNVLLKVLWILSVSPVNGNISFMRSGLYGWLFLGFPETSSSLIAAHSATAPPHPLRQCASLTVCGSLRPQLIHVLFVPFPLTAACPDSSEHQGLPLRGKTQLL